MGFLKNIFKGKKKNKNEDGGGAIKDPSFPSPTASDSRSGGRKGKEGTRVSPSASISTNGSNALNNKNYSYNSNRYNMTSPQSSIGEFGSPRSSTGPVDTDDEGIILPDTENVEVYYEKARNQTQEELRIAYERSQAQRKQNSSMSGDERSAKLNSSGEHSSSSSPQRLTSNKLQQWSDQQQETTVNTQPQQQRIYTMSSALPSQQQISTLDDMNVSESDASSFNLSTDAEDSEYEAMKGGMYYPRNNLNHHLGGLSALDTSAIDTVGSITSYTTDEDRKIFPNLPTDDEMTLGTEASSKAGQLVPPSLLLQPLPNPLQGSQVTVPLRDRGLDKKNDSVDSTLLPAAETSMANNTSINTSINTNNTSNDSSTVKSNSNRQNQVDPSWPGFVADPPNQPTSTKSISRNKPGGTPRNFTSPKSKPTTNTNFSNDGFGSIRTNGLGKANESKNDSGTNTQTNKITTTDDSGFADFRNFADFAAFPSTADIDNGAEWTTVKEEKKDQTSWESHGFHSKSAKDPKSNSSFGNDLDDLAWNVDLSSPSGKNNISSDRSGDDPFRSASAVGASSYVSASSSGFQSTHDTSLAKLLEAAKSKRKDRRSYGGTGTRHSSRLSSTSINSEPAITAAYLRQHHNLGSSNQKSFSGDDLKYNTGASQGNSYSNNTYLNDRAGSEATSVSDIIQNLEATDRTRQISARSMGDVDVVTMARAAKERLRERRRRERELAGSSGRNSTSRHAASRDQYDSDDSDGNKNSESWLFDQVTGAMGPAGIAADLESLSGRSNRSKNSHGGRSNKSSVTGNRRRSSRKPSSRRHKSDRSVDSHGSRASRYSHRSTKSFLSQMSEQSRSVANDLLRLEMQLAMVGNNNKGADGMPTVSSSIRMSSGASLGGGSRASARSSSRLSSARHAAASSSVVRRTKQTIIAPPGKLGIILANKSDSKGTVVSGVRTSSVLVDRISPGDRIVAIDGEDVSRMTVSEITTIMSRKAEYERRLTVLTASGPVNGSVPEIRSPTHSRSSPRAAAPISAPMATPTATAAVAWP